MPLFWAPWLKYRFIKIDLVNVGKFCFNFSRVLGGVLQNVHALTKVGTVLLKMIELKVNSGAPAARSTAKRSSTIIET